MISPLTYVTLWSRIKLCVEQKSRRTRIVSTACASQKAVASRLACNVSKEAHNSLGSVKARLRE